MRNASKMRRLFVEELEQVAGGGRQGLPPGLVKNFSRGHIPPGLLKNFQRGHVPPGLLAGPGCPEFTTLACGEEAGGCSGC